MLELCLRLSVTYYAQNYAGIIGWSLLATPTENDSYTITSVHALSSDRKFMEQLIHKPYY